MARRTLSTARSRLHDFNVRNSPSAILPPTHQKLPASEHCSEWRGPIVDTTNEARRLIQPTFEGGKCSPCLQLSARGEVTRNHAAKGCSGQAAFFAKSQMLCEKL